MDNRNIKDFLKNDGRNNTSNTNNAGGGTGGAGTSGRGGQDTKKIEEKVKKQTMRYSGMSEQQLMQEMFKVAGENKKNGQLDAAQLEAFYKQAAPMLTVPQRNKLRSLINSLK